MGEKAARDGFLAARNGVLAGLAGCEVMGTLWANDVFRYA
jgi:hypothetical protein